MIGIADTGFLVAFDLESHHAEQALPAPRCALDGGRPAYYEADSSLFC